MAELTEREELLKEGYNLDIDFLPNISTKNLKNKIEKYKSENMEEGTDEDSPIDDDVSGDEVPEDKEESGDTKTPEVETEDIEDAAPVQETVIADQLDAILEEFEKMHHRAESPITYAEYVVARGVIGRVKKLMAV